MTNDHNVYDDGLLWSFLRDTMIRGTHISADTQDKPYEEFSARIDAAALQQVDRLKELLDVLKGAPEPGTDARPDCIACNVGNPGVYIKDGRMICPHRPE